MSQNQATKGHRPALSPPTETASCSKTDPTCQMSIKTHTKTILAWSFSIWFSCWQAQWTGHTWQNVDELLEWCGVLVNCYFEALITGRKGTSLSLNEFLEKNSPYRCHRAETHNLWLPRQTLNLSSLQYGRLELRIQDVWLSFNHFLLWLNDYVYLMVSSL